MVADARKVAEVQLTPNMIRVPLDIQRHGMRSLQWRPYVITPETVSSQRDLLSIVHGLRELHRHTRRVVPLLIDMDVHYRLMKLVYGQSFCAWDFGKHLSLTPLLYGVCYECFVTNVHFLSNICTSRYMFSHWLDMKVSRPRLRSHLSVSSSIGRLRMHTELHICFFLAKIIL